MFNEPVNVRVSTFAVNNVVPAAPKNDVDPVTINEPEMMADPVNGKDEAAAAFNAYEAVAAYDELNAVKA